MNATCTCKGSACPKAICTAESTRRLDERLLPSHRSLSGNTDASASLTFELDAYAGAEAGFHTLIGSHGDDPFNEVWIFGGLNLEARLARCPPPPPPTSPPIHPLPPPRHPTAPAPLRRQANLAVRIGANGNVSAQKTIDILSKDQSCKLIFAPLALCLPTSIAGIGLTLGLWADLKVILSAGIDAKFEYKYERIVTQKNEVTFHSVESGETTFDKKFDEAIVTDPNEGADDPKVTVNAYAKAELE